MRSLGACPTQAQVKQIIAEIDPQGTGLVDYSVFESVMKKNKGTGLTAEEVCEAFRVFDKVCRDAPQFWVLGGFLTFSAVADR
mmetsp:Transcript_11910/g.49709  ORF Transcript_11910/g.49709 Transcript_11910/m.49709 type:complete len:83 (+) Transcript_11910:364-612(+)